jgi:hypothetical protein
MTDALLSFFEQKGWPPTASGTARAASASNAKIDVAAKLQDLWK